MNHRCAVSLLMTVVLLDTARLHAGPAEAEAQKCEERIAAVTRDVLGKYEDSLNEMQLAMQRAADLEGALAVRAERQRIAKDHTLTEKDFVPEPKALRALQQQTHTRLRELSAQAVYEALPKLIEFKKSLTVAGKLDEALAARTAIEKLQNDYIPLTKVDGNSTVGAETLISAYSADRVRGDKSYKGQRFVVRGVVGGFRADPGDAKILLLYLTGGNASGWVQCAFGHETKWREEKTLASSTLILTEKDGDVIRVQKGQPFEVRGHCEGWDEVVRMNKCDLPPK